MKYEVLKKEGVIEHPDKGNLDIVAIEGFVETPTIPTLSRYAGTISQVVTSDHKDIRVESFDDWITTELNDGPASGNLNTWNLNINYQANTTGDYRKANITITIGTQENIVEVVQRG